MISVVINNVKTIRNFNKTSSKWNWKLVVPSIELICDQNLLIILMWSMHTYVAFIWLVYCVFEVYLVKGAWDKFYILRNLKISIKEMLTVSYVYFLMYCSLYAALILLYLSDHNINIVVYVLVIQLGFIWSS